MKETKIIDLTKHYECNIVKTVEHNSDRKLFTNTKP